MDLTKFDLNASESAAMEVRMPGGDVMMKSDGKTPVTIRMLPHDHDTVKKHRNVLLNMASKRRSVTAESNEADFIRVLARATVGWDGIGIGEDETPFSEENAILLYTRFPFIREQADAFFSERPNFLKS
jgi:hypothetical protein